MTKYYVSTSSKVTEFKDLGKATLHYSKMARVFPVVKLIERNTGIYGTRTSIVLSQNGFSA